jgi:anti-sigma factor RsiW
MTEHPRAGLSAYLDGELPPKEAQAVEHHLERCTECSRELALMRDLGGAMRSMEMERGSRSVWEGVHRRLTQPIGWVLIAAGMAIWAGLVVVAWWQAELTWEWVAATGVGVGLLLLLIAIGHEQYREWKTTRYKDVER